MADGTGYVYGDGDRFPRVGPKDKFHWRVKQGTAIPYWSLYNGNKEIGLEVYPIHEVGDRPDYLNQMLEGLNNGYAIKAS